MLITFLISARAFSQSPLEGNVKIFKTGSEESKDFVTLTKVWGLLKYTHPSITEGNIDWDKSLVNATPKLLEKPNSRPLDTILAGWLRELGSLPLEDKAAVQANFKIKFKPDFSWINQSSLTNDTKIYLTNLLQIHSSKDQKYITFSRADDVVIPSFLKENNYVNMGFPSLEYRLLAIARYWNIIEYWYPYKHFFSDEWVNVLPTMIHQAALATTDEAYIETLNKMIGTIQDGHSLLINVDAPAFHKKQGEYLVPIKFKFVDGRGILQEASNILTGEIEIKNGLEIQSIDDIPVKDALLKLRRSVFASNESSFFKGAERAILRSKDSISKVGFREESGREFFVMTKNIKTSVTDRFNPFQYTYQKDSVFMRPKKDVLYVNISNFNRSDSALYVNLLRQSKSLIVDNRGYPKTKNTAGDIIGYQLLPGKTDMAIFSTLNPGYPGLFSFSKPLSLGKENENYFKGQVFILVNEYTISASESQAMLFQQAPNAKTVGSQTAGANGNVAYIYLPGGYLTSISGLGIYYPNGDNVQRTGVRIDVKVSPT